LPVSLGLERVEPRSGPKQHNTCLFLCLAGFMCDGDNATRLEQRSGQLETIPSVRLGFQYLLPPQSPLQRWLHLHLAELFDGEVEVIEGILLLIRVVV